MRAGTWPTSRGLSPQGGWMTGLCVRRLDSRHTCLQPGERWGTAGRGSTCPTGGSEDKVGQSQRQGCPEPRSSRQESRSPCGHRCGRPASAPSSAGLHCVWRRAGRRLDSRLGQVGKAGRRGARPRPIFRSHSWSSFSNCEAVRIVL